MASTRVRPFVEDRTHHGQNPTQYQGDHEDSPPRYDSRTECPKREDDNRQESKSEGTDELDGVFHAFAVRNLKGISTGTPSRSLSLSGVPYFFLRAFAPLQESPLPFRVSIGFYDTTSFTGIATAAASR